MTNIQTPWIIAIALCLAACGSEESAKVQDSGPDQAADAATEIDGMAMATQSAIVSHMHKHAARLEDLNRALAEGNLEAAATPAYWLSRHDSAPGISGDWRDHLKGMREAASKVEMAADLETARAAAREISDHCQACHAAAGVDAAK